MVRIILGPKPKGKRGAKEKGAQLSVILGKEKLMTPPNCLVTIGHEAMVFASTRMRAGTAMMALKGVVIQVPLWQ